MLRTRRFIPLLSLILTLLILAACAPAAPQATPTAVPSDTPQPTATMIPFTPTPEMDSVGWVSSRDDELARQVSARLQTLAADAGMQIESAGSVEALNLRDSMRVVVLYAPEIDPAALAAAHPNQQFVVISDGALPAAANLSVIGSRYDQVLFAGGYLSMLLANDWRTVGLIAVDTPLGNAAAWAFFNGGGYFCGRCMPLSPPYVQFPLLVNLPAAADAASWEAGVQEIENNRFNVAFIDGKITDSEVYNRMAQRGFVLVGSGTPPAGLESVWAASVQSDLVATLDEIWPRVLAGESAGVRYARLLVTQVNSQILGEGKIQLFNQMADELEQGLISPAFQPAN